MRRDESDAAARSALAPHSLHARSRPLSPASTSPHTFTSSPVHTTAAHGEATPSINGYSYRDDDQSYEHDT